MIRKGHERQFKVLTQFVPKVRRFIASVQVKTYNLAVPPSLVLSSSHDQPISWEHGSFQFPPDLPVSQNWEQIAEAILKNPVTIVCGETGSGKTTQLPKIALACGRGRNGQTIGHTQPRRLAAVTVARRIAEELAVGCGPGPSSAVGFKVRFNDQSRLGVPIKLMTDGILLAELQADPMLSRYDTIIVDETHERSLNIDFLLGYLQRLVPRRGDNFRLVITSATLDVEKFSRHFALNGKPAPVIEVSGRLFPISMVYRPPQDESDAGDLADHMADVVCEILHTKSFTGLQQVSYAARDVLCFLPGEREIRSVIEAVQERLTGLPLGQQVELIALYSRLTQAEQDRVFRPGGLRRVVFATNVAETSITVPRIGYVVDSGLARIKRYRVRGKVEQLQIEPIAQAQAKQRAGRCGRVGPGICFRLFNEEEFLTRPVDQDPEIRRASLGAVILRMLSMGIEDIPGFAFIDPPSGRALADGMALLSELKAIEYVSGRTKLTKIGRTLADVPLDPRFARILIAAREHACLKEALLVVTGLSLSDPRERPLDRQRLADAAHQRFADERSEFLSIVRLWTFIETIFQGATSRRKLDQKLRAEFLSPSRVREWRELYHQVHDWVGTQNWRLNERPSDYASLHQALLSGLLSNVGCRLDEKNARDKGLSSWQGCHEIRFYLWPGSSLRRKPPRWLLAAEQVDTTRLFARTVAGIEPEWVEHQAGPLLRWSYSSPHWEKKSGKAVGCAKATLYGLTVVAQRRVAWASLGRQQALEARGLLIREGLVHGELPTSLDFIEHNQRQVKELERLEQKSRRFDLLVDESLIEAFYESHLPASVLDFDSLVKWYRSEKKEKTSQLRLSRDDLLRRDAKGVSSDQFPRTVKAPFPLAVDYHFEPGAADDGLTLTVPLSGLASVQASQAEWLVPGMLKEKVLALVKSLPKAFRRSVVPLESFADEFVERWTPRAREFSLVRSLVLDLAESRGLSVKPDDFRRDSLAVHLQPIYKVVDEHGRMLAKGRDLAQIRELLDCQEQTDEGNQKELDFVRALELPMKEFIRSLEKHLQSDQSLLLVWSLWGGAKGGSLELLREQIVAAAYKRVGMLDDPLPKDVAQMDERVQRCRPKFLLVAQELQRQLLELLTEHQRLTKRLSTATLTAAVKKDIQVQLARLLPNHFLVTTPYERFRHLARYLKAIGLRLEKYHSDPRRDEMRRLEQMRVEQPFWTSASRYRGQWSEAMVEYRWMLEECRVVQFAQELKAPFPISVKRLEKSWANLSRDFFQ
jgi:ATP-dependent helicase HrpA